MPLLDFRIFLSSTSQDLIPHRSKIHEVLERLGTMAVRMETFNARPTEPLITCKQAVQKADALVVVVGHRYGWIPTAAQGGDGFKSITWWEVLWAQEKKKPVFAFLVNGGAEDEDISVADERIVPFRRHLESTTTRELFTSVDDLAVKVATSLAPWISEQHKLSATPFLSIPTVPLRQSNRFYFGSQRIQMVGRDSEMDALRSFSRHDKQFLWWSIVGPAGVGKSRLALELAVELQPNWISGFLSPLPSQPFDWLSWQPRTDTLIVVDYASSRTKSIHELLASLAQRQSTSEHRVRVLILERQAEGSWLRQLLGTGGLRHAIRAAAFQEAPLALGELPTEAVLHIMAGSTNSRSANEVLSTARRLDPSCRPLVLQFLAEAIRLNEDEGADDVTDLVQDLLDRERARWETANVTIHDENLLALATLFGETSFSQLPAFHLDDHFDLDRFDPARYEAMTGRPVGESVHPLEPDLVGEYFVLLHLSGKSPTVVSRRQAFQRAIGLFPDRAKAFVQRTALDFPTHPMLGELLQAVSGNSETHDATKLSLAIMDEHLKRSHFSRCGVNVHQLVSTMMGEREDAELVSRLHAFIVGAEAARGGNLTEATALYSKAADVKPRPARSLTWFERAVGWLDRPVLNQAMLSRSSDIAVGSFVEVCQADCLGAIAAAFIRTGQVDRGWESYRELLALARASALFDTSEILIGPSLAMAYCLAADGRRADVEELFHSLSLLAGAIELGEKQGLLSRVDPHKLDIARAWAGRVAMSCALTEFDYTPARMCLSRIGAVVGRSRCPLEAMVPWVASLVDLELQSSRARRSTEFERELRLLRRIPTAAIWGDRDRDDLLRIAECCASVANSLASQNTLEAVALLRPGVDRYARSVRGFGVPVLTFLMSAIVEAQELEPKDEERSLLATMIEQLGRHHLSESDTDSAPHSDTSL